MEQPKQCEECGKLISERMAWFSLREYGNELCIADQLTRKRFGKDYKESEPDKEDIKNFDEDEQRDPRNFEII